MKKFYYKTVKICGLILIALGIGNSFIVTSSINQNFINLNSVKLSILYGDYYLTTYDAYTYNVIEWSFDTENQSKIVVLKMDYENYQKFYINDSNAEYQTLSEGRTKDNGITSVPYDNEWIILFFNADSSRSSTHIEIDVKILSNPVFYIFLPLTFILLIIASFITISLYYKRKKKKNRLTNYFGVFIVFLGFYLYIYLSIIPLIQYLRA